MVLASEHNFPLHDISLNLNINENNISNITLPIKPIKSFGNNEEPRYNPNFKNENKIESITSSCSSETDVTDIVDLENLNDNSMITNKKIVSLFIGDLNEKVTEEMLTQMFNKLPSFISCKICIDKNTDQSLGYGYLNFYSKEDADKATEEFNYIPILGKEIRLMPSIRNTFYRKNIGTNVFFSNLPLENPSLTTRVFYDEFKSYGKILSCKLDRRKNIGFVYFENYTVAKEAIHQNNGKIFYGNEISCGIHFDRNVRNSPEFEKRKANLEDTPIIKESLLIDDESAKLQVHSAHSNSKNSHPNSIFVKNLPINQDSDEVMEHFSRLGPIKSIYLSNVEKFNSSWAFITYKKTSDAREAIKSLNQTFFKAKTIDVSKAQKNVNSNSKVGNLNKYINLPINNSDSTFYKQIVYLSNLSSICNYKFLECFCHQERIKFKRIYVRYYDEFTSTFAGYIICHTKNDSSRLFELLNKKLLGDTVIRASWQPLQDANYIDTSQIPLKQKSATSIMDKCVLPHNIPSVSYENNNSFKNTFENPSRITLSHFTGQFAQMNDNMANVNTLQEAQASKHLMNELKNEVKKCIDFLRYHLATRKENITTISFYMFEVFYQGKQEILAKVLLLKQHHNYFEARFQDQVHEAINQLGLQGR